MIYAMTQDRNGEEKEMITKHTLNTPPISAPTQSSVLAVHDDPDATQGDGDPGNTARAKDRESTSTSESTQACPDTTSTERIFIAEDEESIRTLMARFLSAKGFEVWEAPDGKEALEQIKTLPGLDLLLTDMIMPEMGGYPLSEAVKEIYPDLKTIYISGYTDHEQGEAELNTPTSIFVQKPFLLETIYHSIRHLLDHKGTD
jgi:CheY-like chemotaxis protein